ncbi:hypothetical protein ACMD2_26977 [Ananas comosus]|uniref:Uncharacterized protein n=1 Tax=Ananas comosus TaxID=4615 RepID=A0A199VPH4_ANACO|nr:hypothetical protein ACMD2_26977 [Ananas comosus]
MKKLIKVEFITHIHYPDWLANVVPVSGEMEGTGLHTDTGGELEQSKALAPPSLGQSGLRSHGNKLQRGGGLSRSLREHTSRLYIIRRCVVMLLCYHD